MLSNSARRPTTDPLQSVADFGTGRRLFEAAIKAGETCANGHDHVADVEGDVRNEDRELIQWEEDAAIMKLVRTWPGDFITSRGESMGFVCDTNYDDVVRAYMDDELSKH